MEASPHSSDPVSVAPLVGLQGSFFLERQAGGPSSIILAEFTGERLARPEAVREALRALVARHGALRTRFGLREGRLQMEELPEGALEWEALSGEDASAAAWEPRIQARLRRGFEPEAARPFAAIWKAEGPEAGRLALFCDHLSCDGISMARVATEMGTLLEGKALPPLSAPSLADGAAKLSAARDEAAAQDDLAYWTGRLEGLEGPQDLPAGMGEPGAEAETLCASQVLPASLVAGLEARAKALQVKPLSLLAAALGQVWAYWEPKAQVLVNLSVHGRQDGLNLRRSVGAYSDILPCALAGAGVHLDAAVIQAQASLDEAMAHGAAGGVELARHRAAREGRRPSALSPLTLTSGLFYDWDMGAGLHCARVHVQAPETWLDLMVFRDGAGWQLAWNHRHDRISSVRCQRLQRQLRTLLEALVQGVTGDPWPLLGEASDFRGLALEAQALPPPAWLEQSLSRRFRAQVQAAPQAIAVSGEGADYSYAELDRLSDGLAAALRAAGAGPGGRVGIHLERGPHLAVAILGVIKSGAAYVPMDPLYPAERLRFMAEDGGLQALVCGPDADPGLAPGCPRLTPLQADASTPVEDRNQPADPAYIIYTSGSTGRPKGVVVRHTEVLRLFSATEPWFRFGRSDVWTLFHSYSFDFSVWELFGALLYGGRLVVVPADLARSPADFHALLRREGVTVLNQTPSAFQALMAADAAAPARLERLRTVIFGGEALELGSLGAWYERYDEAAPRLVNMYGITETTVHVTYRPLTRADIRAARGSLIGVPIPDLFLKLLDAQGRPVPVGVAGEIHVGGSGLAEGYWQRPDLTAQRFIQSPWGRLYRSGDRARCLPDGELEYLGRGDEQVKIRGFRVELGEIQARLAADPAVGSAVVQLRQDPRQGARLAAFVVPAMGARLDAEGLAALRQRLSVQLPPYMLPALAAVPALPLTANGKLDSAALPDPWAEAAGTAPARTPLEQALLELWRAHLRQPDAGVEDDFFASGGQSLSAAAFHAAAEAIAQRRLPLAAFLAKPTVRALAQAFESAEPRAAAKRELGQGPWPAPAPVAALWAAQAADPSSPALHIALALRGRAPLDAQALRLRLQALQAAQPALRLSLRQAEDASLWMHLSDCGLPFHVAPADAPTRVVDALEWLQVWQAQPFDLAQAPLWRAVLLDVEGGWLLGVCLHHAIADQRSIELLLDCLDQGSPRDGSAFADLSRLPLGAALPASALSNLLGPPSEDRQAPRRLQRVLEPALKSALQGTVAAAQSTPFAAVCAAWRLALAAAGWQGSLRVPVSLRQDEAQGAAMGYGVAPLPLDLALDPSSTGARQMAETAQALRRLQGEPRWRSGGSAEIFLAWEAAPRALAVLGQPADLLELEPQACKAALALTVRLEPQLRLRLDFDPGRLSPEAAQSLLHATERHLRRMALQPQAVPATALPRLRGPQREPSELRTVLERFHRQVELRPEAVALVWHGGRLDYASLARRAGAMAGYLRQLGLEPGQRVGVHAAPGPLWAAAVLACLEAELVYVPLDPAYPSARLRAMALDADCRCVLSDRDPDADWGPPWHSLERAWSHPTRHLRSPGRPRPEAEAYVIFTSGSSGRPRGVRVPHQALENLSVGFAAALNLGPGDRVLQFVSISFDASLEELLPALCSGAAVALPCRQGAPAPDELLAHARELEATVLHLPAAYWHACARSGASLASLEDLRALVLGGEAPDPLLVQELLLQAPGLRLFNAYGPTEAGISATMQQALPGQRGPLALGRPLPGVELRVVSSEEGAASAGQEGELWIAGAGLALGYLDPRDDAGRFVLSSGPDGRPQRWYRTGDRVGVGADAELRYLGRLDREVKVAGQRLDLEGLERLLSSLPGVAQAFAALHGEGDAAVLKAWALPELGQALDAPSLLQALRERLPAGQVPSQLRVLRELPLTPNGKVDRARLDAAEAPVLAQRPAPADPLLDALCALWGRLLGSEAAHPSADFFALGGGSLKAVRAAAEASKLLGRAVRVTDLQAASTPLALRRLGQRPLSVPAALTLRSGSPWTRVAGAAGSGPAWLLLPPAGAEPLAWRELAQALGRDAEVWSLDWQAVDLSGSPAEAWQRAQRQVLESLPLGPGPSFRVLGWSVGGLLAAALSPALQAQRAGLQRLVLVDAHLPGSLGRSALAVQAGLPGLVQQRAGAPADASFAALVRAASSFEPAALPVPVTLALSEDSARRDAQDACVSWALLARAGLWTILLPGTHHDLLDHGGAQLLAEALAAEPEGALA
jgi:amino acid adenylation domain-containing protein